MGCQHEVSRSVLQEAFSTSVTCGFPVIEKNVPEHTILYVENSFCSSVCALSGRRKQLLDYLRNIEYVLEYSMTPPTCHVEPRPRVCCNKRHRYRCWPLSWLYRRCGENFLVRARCVTWRSLDVVEDFYILYCSFSVARRHYITATRLIAPISLCCFVYLRAAFSD